MKYKPYSEVTYKPGDVVYIAGVIEPNRRVRGIVHHEFSGHWPGDKSYVIAVDVLDGGFEVRGPSTCWGSEDCSYDDHESREFDSDWVRQRGLSRN